MPCADLTETTCINCSNTIDMGVPGWYDVDDGVLCPECAEEMFDSLEEQEKSD